MDWNTYRKFHKAAHGTTTRDKLSKDYKKYNASLSKKSPSKSRNLPYKQILSSMPKTRVYRKHQLESVMKHKGEGRGSPARGWGAAAPQRGSERQALKKRCGNDAFLLPSSMGYPVMSMRASPKKPCKVQCQGVAAARNRACQYHKCDVAKKATKVGVKKCKWPKEQKPCKTLCQ